MVYLKSFLFGLLAVIVGATVWLLWAIGVSKKLFGTTAVAFNLSDLRSTTLWIRILFLFSFGFVLSWILTRRLARP